MSSIFRLAGQQFGSQILKNEKGGLFYFIRPVAAKAKSAVCVKDEGHDERNMRLKRPQSPHLTIYSPQLTSMLSISHRFTGIALSAYAIGLGLGAVVLPEPIPDYIDDLECAEIGEICINVMKFILAFPLTYHFWNGVRHLFWDAGFFLSIKQVYMTGYIMVILAISSAVTLIVM